MYNEIPKTRKDREKTGSRFKVRTFEVPGSTVRSVQVRQFAQSRFDSSLSPGSTVRSVQVRQFAQSRFDSSLSPGSTVLYVQVRQFATSRFNSSQVQGSKACAREPLNSTARTLELGTPEPSNLELPTSNSQRRTPNVELRTSNSEPRTPTLER